jgi:hypothetical protein
MDKYHDEVVGVFGRFSCASPSLAVLNSKIFKDVVFIILNPVYALYLHILIIFPNPTFKNFSLVLALFVLQI